MQLHPQEALLQQVRALQQSEALSEYRQRRVVVEHRLARLVQLGIRQSRYFGRIKTRFQLYLAATVANLTLVLQRRITRADPDFGLDERERRSHQDGFASLPWKPQASSAKSVVVILTPNPPMDTDGRREDSGRGMRELQAR